MFNTWYTIWRLWCQKQLSHAVISNYIPQFTVWCTYLTYSCLRYLLLMPKSSYEDFGGLSVDIFYWYHTMRMIIIFKGYIDQIPIAIGQTHGCKWLTRLNAKPSATTMLTRRYLSFWYLTTQQIYVSEQSMLVKHREGTKEPVGFFVSDELALSLLLGAMIQICPLHPMY